MARARSHTVVAWLSVGVVLLIAYGSLYPFNLKPGVHVVGWWHGFVYALSQLSWARAGRSDHIANLLLYVPLGFCLALWWQDRLHRAANVILATVVGTVLSFAIEMAQVYISLRVASYWDVTLNACGSLCGAIGAVAWQGLSARLPSALASGAADSNRAARRLAWIVVVLWLAWRWAPFEPQFSLSKLKAALQPLFEPQLAVVAAAVYLIWWTVIAQAIFTVAGALRGLEILLLVIAMVLVGQLFVCGLVFVPAEMLALLLLLPVLVVINRLRSPSRRALLLVACIAALCVDALSPFTWSRGSSFDLWPFLGWMDAGFPVNLHALCKQLFGWAALFWLLCEAGVSLSVASIAVPVCALILELVALWLPGRAGSITAPALALATAWAMHYAASAARRDGFIRRRVRTH